jgi:hypothetical protein
LYREVSLIVGNLNRCRADMMSRAVDLVVDHGMGSNVDKRLDNWLGRCGERRRVDVGMEHVGNIVTTGMCCGIEPVSNRVSGVVSCWVESVSN